MLYDNCTDDYSDDYSVNSSVNSSRKFLRCIVPMVCAAACLAAGATSAGAAEAFRRAGVDCRRTAAADSNATLRLFRADGRECFATRLAAKGRLTLDVAVPGPAAAEPRLEFLGRACEEPGSAGRSHRYEKRSAAAMSIAIGQPGSYVFCVAAQDPGRPLEELKVRTGFAAAAFAKEGDPEEDEPPPDPKARARAIRAICRLGEVDDHGDSPFCATPLHRRAGGELGNDWGDDHDYFVLTVGELETFRIRSTGETDTFGSLYDHRGYRIAADDDGGPGANFRIVKTLVPGRYWIRVEGRGGAEGAYRLHADPVR